MPPHAPFARIRLGAMAAALALGACAGTPERPGGAASIPPGEYARAFQAAKDALREAHFNLARVDAAGGVITTQPRSSAGLATPWIDHADSLSESVEGVLHRDRRRAIVRFRPPDVTGEAPFLDRRVHEGPLLLEVRVGVERTYVSGRRADPTSIRLTSVAIDPKLVDEGLHPLARGTVREDEALAARIAARIEKSIEAGKPAESD